MPFSFFIKVKNVFHFALIKKLKGINVSINVGTLIGNDVFIGPGRTVSGDIQSNTRYT